MLVKIKKLNDAAVVPKYAKPGDACVDLYATGREGDKYNITYYTGLAVEIPEGHVGLLFPRSSISKKNITLANSVGVIDSGYRGEIMLKFKKTCGTYGDKNIFYDVGERVGQLMILPYPRIEFVEADELNDTARGTGGFGSTGN